MLCAVTGANGFVGSHLVQRLREKGHSVRVLVRPEADLRWLQDAVVEVVQGGLTDVTALGQLADGVDVVFHVAGVTSSNDPELFYTVNRDGVTQVCQACAAAAPRLKRLLLVSSMAAVGPAPEGEQLTESTDPRPINHYGRSKLAGEQELWGWADRLPLTVVRPGAIYGPRDRDVLALLRVAALGFRVYLGLSRRLLNFCHVRDVVDSTILAATHPEGEDQTFNVGAAQNHTLDEVGRVMARAAGRGDGWPLWLPLSVTYAAGAVGGAVARVRGGRPTLNIDRVRLLTARNWAMDVSKLQQTLGFIHSYDLESGVAETVSWCREVGWLTS